MVSCLMGDSTALASAIVRCCLNIFCLRQNVYLPPVIIGCKHTRTNHSESHIPPHKKKVAPIKIRSTNLIFIL